MPASYADRLQDDWFIGTDTLSNAETILSSITSVYRHYGLEINGSKTSIDRIVTISASPWRSELAAFLSHGRGALSGNRLREFLSLSLRLQASAPSDPIINYAMSVIEGVSHSNEDIASLETFLIKAATVSPISLDKICRVIINLDTDGKVISKQRIAERFVTLAERNLENGNTYEVIWLLYTLRGLKIRIRSKKICDLIADYPGSSLPLLLLDMKSKGLFVGKLPVDYWEGLIDDKRIECDWIWLLAYEGIRNGWLKDLNSVMSKRFFKPLKNRNIKFYDQTKNVMKSKKIRSDRISKSKKNTLYVNLLLDHLRGFSTFSEYF